MKAAYLNHMGDDLTVVNSARVSFDKSSSLEFKYDSKGVLTYSGLSDRDIKLIKYLAKHNHWTPFAHCFIQMRIKAPIFVARQLDKHQVGLVKNEVSRRYVNYEPELYWPDVWYKQAENKKQGRSDEPHPMMLIRADRFGTHSYNLETSSVSAAKRCVQMYNDMIEAGVASEQARMILPQNMYTEWYWTGSLFAFSRVHKLRTNKEDVQGETTEIANQIGEICRPLFPVSWEALTGSTSTEKDVL